MSGSSRLTIMDDLEWSIRTHFQNTCVFGVQHENSNEDRPTFSLPILTLRLALRPDSL